MTTALDYGTVSRDDGCMMSCNPTASPNTRSSLHRPAQWVGAGVMLVALVLYLLTLLTDVPLNDDPNLVDVGEIQIALNLWGTLHHTGYPFYTILGSAFTAMHGFLGGNPAAGPSLFSLLWAIAALGLIYVLYLDVLWPTMASSSKLSSNLPGPVALSSRRSDPPSLSASQPPPYLNSRPSSSSPGASTVRDTSAWRCALAVGIGTLFVAVTSAFWINAAIAEVYSMYMALIVASLLLACRLSRCWSDRAFIWLAVVLGSAGAHYRLAAFVLPGVAIYIAPNLWRRVRSAWWLVPAGALAGLAMFLPYLYLPLRAGQGAPWVFGEPDTWDGFWRIFIGPGRVIGGPSPAEAVSGPLRITRTLLGEAHPLGVMGGLAGLAALLLRRPARQDAIALLSLLPAYMAAAVRFPIAAVAENFLMVVIVALGAGISALLAWLVGRWRTWGWVALAATALLVAALGSRGYAKVRPITLPGQGPDLVSMIDRVPRMGGETEPAVMLPWGSYYFAAYFARHVAREIEGVAVVDHNTDFVADLAAGRRLYTLPLTFHHFPLQWWERRLGEVYLAAAAPEVVEISNRPIVRAGDLPEAPSIRLGDGIELVAATAEGEPHTKAIVFTLYFRADPVPSTDYAVSVRVTEEVSIYSGDDILAQLDASHPVFGWYPTSRWRPGEIVRDVYLVALPDGARPHHAEVLLYEQLASGEYRDLEPAVIELAAKQR